VAAAPKECAVTHPTSSRGSLLTIICALAAAWFAAGCAAIPDERQATFGIDFNVPGEAEAGGPNVILFFLDGTSASVFDEMLEAGRLPNFKKYFVDRGLYSTRDTTNVPSTTLPNEVSLVTGVHPGHHNVLGNNWFDRNRLFLRDCEEVGQKNKLDDDYIVPTIYEHLGDSMTMSLFYQAHRGASDFTENALSAAPSYFLGLYELVDRISLWRFDKAMGEARVRRRFPRFTICYLLATDMNAYAHGTSSAQYHSALEHADTQIGRILRDLEKAGRLDRTILALTSDHGMMDIHHHMNIIKFLRDDLRLAVTPDNMAENTEFDSRLLFYNKSSCVPAGSGDRYWMVNLRKPRAGGDPKNPEFEDWLVRPSEADFRSYPGRDGTRSDLISRLCEKEAVDVVAWKAGPDAVRLATRAGVAEVTRIGPAAPGATGGLSASASATAPGTAQPSVRFADAHPRFSLKTIAGTDPLGYAGTVPAAMLDGSAHDDREWLRATADSPHPDLVPQIIAYFDAPRAPDLAVFAAAGWDFSDNGLRGGHGGLLPEDMHTVLLLAGPGVPHERRTEPVRAVDIMPTLLELLGRPMPAGLDGRSLLAK